MAVLLSLQIEKNPKMITYTDSSFPLENIPFGIISTTADVKWVREREGEGEGFDKTQKPHPPCPVLCLNSILLTLI